MDETDIELEKNGLKKVLRIVGYTLLGLGLSGWLGWHIWVTTSIYAGQSDNASGKVAGEAVAKGVIEIKDDVRTLKETLDKRNEKMHEQYQNILEKLIQIEKNGRKK